MLAIDMIKLLIALAGLVASVALGSPLGQPSDVSVPIVIWHGLGDRYDAPGLLSLKDDLESRPNLRGVFVHIIQIGTDGVNDQHASFFGNANAQVDLACGQLRNIPEIVSSTLNPSGKFDAIGFSQGGQLLRAVVERCGGQGGLNVRHLITLGSQHMGISALPACPPGSSPFSSCRLMHLAIVREGLYSSFAQRNIVPAQYMRDEARIDQYLEVNHFLRDINNERPDDAEVGPVPIDRRPPFLSQADDSGEPRNATYKANLVALDKLVLVRFTRDTIVVAPQTAHFTLPSPNATNCPPLISEPGCYLDPVEWKDLPLYKEDYVGLRELDERGGVEKFTCEGEHLQIDDECWEAVVAWLGDGSAARAHAPSRPEGEGRLVIQL